MTDPNVIEMEIQEVINTGGGGSDSIWLPEVSEEGVISWTKSESTEAPTPRDIKGPAGADGHDYILTTQDKNDIASIVLGELTEAEGQGV